MKRYVLPLFLWFILSLKLIFFTYSSHAQPQPKSPSDGIVDLRVNTDQTIDVLTPLPNGVSFSFVERYLPPGTLTVPDMPYGRVVDGYPFSWQYYFSADFNDTTPLPDSPTTAFPCQRFDQVPRLDRAYWGKAHSIFSSDEADLSLWPAKDGSGGVDPQTVPYPSQMNSWLVCGPFDVTQATDFQVRYRLTYFDHGLTDSLFMGISWDGEDFFGVKPVPIGLSDWTQYHASFAGVEDKTKVWVAWQFKVPDDPTQLQNEDDLHGPAGIGPWLDDLQVWEYIPPTQNCGEVDSGNKGLVVPADDPTGPSDTFTPIIRHGDMAALYQVAITDAGWARLEFIQEGGGYIDYLDYDLIVDSLCFFDISVLGLVDNQTLERQDANEPTAALEYRQAFAQKVGEIASHYAGRITYWEVWNEENLPPPATAFVDPERYAPLLLESYESIKTANPDAQVLFGGLAGAWRDSAHPYFEQVYVQLNTHWGGARPFDYLAIHPYPNEVSGTNPIDYMYADLWFGEDTILDKFSQTMANNQDDLKTMWITEIGWNAAKESITPPPPPCQLSVQVTEAEQARYLKSAFDILFTGVDLWNYPGIPAVDKVFWYQYMDTGIATPCFDPFPQEETVAWLWGLYDSEKKEIKPSWCAYWAYPLTCRERLSSHAYLPMTSWHVVVSQQEP